MFRIGDKVIVNGEAGTIINIRLDSRGEPIYTVKLDNWTATADGLYLARKSELERQK